MRVAHAVLQPVLLKHTLMFHRSQERPLLEESIGVMNQSVTTDKDNFKVHFRDLDPCLL